MSIAMWSGWVRLRTQVLFMVLSMAVSAYGKVYKFGIVGFGPGGIIAAGALLDAGVDLADIILFDPKYQVGRMGEYYGNVPANNSGRRFIEFIGMCEAFQGVQSPAMQRLRAVDPNREHLLQVIIDPLQDISDYFRTLMDSVIGSVTDLTYEDGAWSIGVGDAMYRAERVILAIGSYPRSLHYDAVEQEIPFDLAINKCTLASIVQPTDTIAVIGGAHSAVLIMKFLSELPIARIINFYRHPLYYMTTAEEQQWRGCEIIGDPLQGVAAAWAREVLDVDPPGNLVRVRNSETARKAWLPICTKIIYAAGFERNVMPTITGISPTAYNPSTGVIGPHLFGIGIAFPELVDEGAGKCKFAIGLRDFMRFAQRVVSEWMVKEGRPYKDIPAYCERFSEVISFTVL